MGLGLSLGLGLGLSLGLGLGLGFSRAGLRLGLGLRLRLGLSADLAVFLFRHFTCVTRDGKPVLDTQSAITSTPAKGKAYVIIQLPPVRVDMQVS